MPHCRGKVSETRKECHAAVTRFPKLGKSATLPWRGFQNLERMSLNLGLIVDVRLCRNIVIVLSTAYQQTTFTIVKAFHASDAASFVEIREAVNLDAPPLLNSHFSYFVLNNSSSYSHSSLILRVLNSILCPFCEVLLGFVVGRTVFRAAITADVEGNKASVRSESADGIPKFWRDEKICGRLPSSPPTESPWRHLTFPPSAVALHGKTALTMKHKGWLQRKKPMLHETWIRWNCKCNLQLHQALQFQHSFTKSPQASSPKCEPAIVERMRNHERLSLRG